VTPDATVSIMECFNCRANDRLDTLPARERIV